jgi:hypothetical protein
MLRGRESENHGQDRGHDREDFQTPLHESRRTIIPVMDREKRIS